MFRSSVAIFTITALISPMSLADPCTSPFAAYPEGFTLEEKLSCDSVTSPVRLEISLQETGFAGILKAECDKNSPYFTMYLGDDKTGWVVRFSDPLANALSTLVRISSTCNGEPLYLIDRQPSLYTLRNNTKVNTNIRVFAQDNARTLIGYVAATEDTTKGLVLRSEDETVLATANKQFFSGSTCSAKWTVSNPGKTEKISVVTAFLINLKDNSDMSCLPQPSCPSQAGTIVASSAMSCAITAALFVGGFLFIKNRYPEYHKLLQ